MNGSTDVIYDFGMNNGDDVEYYLLKGSRVVAVEPNATLCAAAHSRFAEAVDRGQLVVLNVALAERDREEPITFYVHKLNSARSQLPRPSDDIIDQFEPIQVQCRTASSIVREFGPPRYIKIDIEHYDHVILAELFAAGIFPPQISAESHTIEVFALLVAYGYRSFNLVDGKSVVDRYRNAVIQTPEGSRTFSFNYDSAGPFGEDIGGRWEDPETFFYTLAAAGLGWKDIHASKTIPALPPASGRVLAARQARSLLNKLVAAVKWRTIDRLTGRRA